MTTSLLLKFAEFLTGQADDHNRNTIAIFLEKFLVPELEKVERMEGIETKPTKKLSHRCEKCPSRSACGKVEMIEEDKEPSKEVTLDELLETVDRETEGVVVPLVDLSKVPTEGIAPKKSGNGHKILKKRDMTVEEKGEIAKFFTDCNGMISDDACVEWKKNMDTDDYAGWEEVAIFQVVGYVSAMHNRVARGVVELRDMGAYIEFIKAHRNLWSTYCSPKYVALRRRLGIVAEPDYIEAKVKEPVEYEEEEEDEETEYKIMIDTDHPGDLPAAKTTTAEKPAPLEIESDEPVFVVGFKGTKRGGK